MVQDRQAVRVHEHHPVNDVHVVLDGGVGSAATANHMWFLNTKYIMFRPHVDRNFVPIGGERQAVNQDAIVKLIGWAGNICASGPQFSGVLIA